MVDAAVAEAVVASPSGEVSVEPDAVEGALGVESVERTIELPRGGAGEAQLAARSPNGVNRWRVSSSSLRAS